MSTSPRTAAGLAIASLLAACAAQAAVTWYAVDPMSERRFMPDAKPVGGLEGEPVRIVAAQGEYEPGSFVVTADADLGKVDFAVSDLKGEGGAAIPSSETDLATVKVWYQAGNAWFSYFQDTGLKLCPELLLHDEDLIRVDTEKVANYARLTEKDGTVHWRWLTSPRAVENRLEDAGSYRVDDAFLSMKENFQDAPAFAGATIEKGRYKQFFLTVHVGADAKPGLYTGEIALRRRADGQSVGAIPVRLRVLPFALPGPCTYFDWNKEFRTWFCEYVSLDMIRAVNGNDPALAERQLRAILADFVRHNETIPSFREATSRPEFAREAGMDLRHAGFGHMHLSWNKAEMRFAARRLREKAERIAGAPVEGYASWGDEYGLATLRGIRDMVRAYHDEGFLFPVNSHYGYAAGGYLADLFWPPYNPDLSSKNATEHYNNLGGAGHFGWYASQHVGVENPAFIRRQYGLGPYRAGFSANYNYAHHLQGWNDISHSTYRPMMFVYGCGGGCLDTIQWEAFREAIDDIRYATLLQRLARPHVASADVTARYAARKALQCLSDLDGDDYDLGATRLEIIRHILTLQRVCGGQSVTSNK
ncbi:MAG: hypothetical protein IJQ73_06170 [Kiritimatiellae bacterium]|nr:hypothetical protein [Kiritimatiellia bacterium]